MSRTTFQGTLTAIVTPFTQDGSEVDFVALDALVEAQIAGGVSGLVPCGTTGEAPTLSDEEQIAVIRRVVERTKGRVPVVAGTGSFSTKKTIAASLAAKDAGVDGVMVVMPYYNKPSQDGMRAHVVAVAEKVELPIILYNIPGRSVVDLAVDTTEKICQDAPNVVAMKEATGNVLRCQELLHRLGDRLTVLSGDDGLTVPMMSLGAKGVISVTSNVFPKAVSAVTTAWLEGRVEDARRAHFALLDFHAAFFVEPNPAPAKAALHILGKRGQSFAMSPAVRGPMLAASPALTAKLEALLERAPLGVRS